MKGTAYITSLFMLFILSRTAIISLLTHTAPAADVTRAIPCPLAAVAKSDNT